MGIKQEQSERERVKNMSKLLLTILLVFLIIGAAMSLYAEIRTNDFEYRHNGVVLQGYFAYDDSIRGKRPGVLIIHEWTGLGDYVKGRARQLAAEGYVAFAMDMYGKGIRPTTAEEAGAQAGIYRSNHRLMRERAAVSLDQLKAHRLTDPARVAAIGYCFGGGAALELARSGADLSGVVSLHGNLDTPNPDDARNIKAKVLVLHGADDPFVPKKVVDAFQEEMRNAGVDWQLVLYGNAVHAFTNPDSGNDNSRGAAYNERADKRSYRAMIDFFNEIFM
jgi:dienelactone hydrolase